MSKSRKHVKMSMLEFPEPTGSQKIAQVLNTLGSNQIEVQLPSGEKMLVLLPQKFSKLLWTKKHDFVIISTDKQIGPDHRWKVKGIIDTILLPDHVRHLKKIGLMPPEFINQEEEEAKENLGWEGGNPNRREDSDDEDEDEDSDSEEEKPKRRPKDRPKPIVTKKKIVKEGEEEEKDAEMVDKEGKEGEAEEEWEDVDEDDDSEEEEGEGDEDEDEEWVTDEDNEEMAEEAKKKVKLIPKQKWIDGMYEFEEISEDEIPEDAIIEEYD